ncbi:MAG: hypothetical protein U1E57_01500 [Paenacidovorax caeni]
MEALWVAGASVQSPRPGMAMEEAVSCTASGPTCAWPAARCRRWGGRGCMAIITEWKAFRVRTLLRAWPKASARPCRV